MLSSTLAFTNTCPSGEKLIEKKRKIYEAVRAKKNTVVIDGLDLVLTSATVTRGGSILPVSFGNITQVSELKLMNEVTKENGKVDCTYKGDTQIGTVTMNITVVDKEGATIVSTDTCPTEETIIKKKMAIYDAARERKNAVVINGLNLALRSATVSKENVNQPVSFGTIMQVSGLKLTKESKNKDGVIDCTYEGHAKIGPIAMTISVVGKEAERARRTQLSCPSALFTNPQTGSDYVEAILRNGFVEHKIGQQIRIMPGEGFTFVFGPKKGMNARFAKFKSRKDLGDGKASCKYELRKKSFEVIVTEIK